MVGDPWGLKALKSTQRLYWRQPAIHPYHFSSLSVKGSARCQMQTATLLGHFSPATPRSKPVCFHPSHPPSDPSLQNKPQPGLPFFFSTSLIRLLLWSCEKRGGRTDPREGGTTCRPLPPKVQTQFKGSQHSP